MGPRATSRLMIEQLFKGWSSVESYYDEGTRQHVVRLTATDKLVHSLAMGFDGPAAVVDRLWPKNVAKPRSGVRFHGRIVGRRA